MKSRISMAIIPLQSGLVADVSCDEALLALQKWFIITACIFVKE
jgi:hypothetical protein